MLILYNKNERQFLSNGIGRLDKHAFDDKVREELNGIYKLEFTYPIHAPHSKDIENDNIVRATVPDGEQPFFISRIVKKDGYLRVTAYHLFYRLIWQLIEDINIVNLNGQAALNRVLENTEFTGVSDITTTKNIRIVRYNAVEAILNPGKDNTLISRFGGELKRDKLTVMLMNRIGRTYENNPVEIRYAKNLLSYEADISDSNVATRVMPIGFDGLLLPEKYVVKPGADPTDYKTVKVEYTSIRAISNPDSPKEGELPLEDAYEALRQAVLSDFESGRFDLKASYQVRFQELSTTEEYKNKSVFEKVYLGDEIKVIHTDEDLQILSRVVAYEWSPIRKEYDEVELGSHIDTFSDIKPTLEMIAGKVEQYKTDWENNVDEITELLTTALGGYVLKRPGELLIMDTEDPATATKVWRWNLNGLGYSGTGINGPYETAITMDGRIIAKFIYTLNLSSISANLGVVTAGRIQDKDNESFWDLDGKEIKLNVNELKILGEDVSLKLGTLEDGVEGIALQVGGIKVGGRNLLRDAGVVVENSSYNIRNYNLAEPIADGEEVTLTIKGNLGAGKSYFAAYNSGGTVNLANLEYIGNGLYRKTFNWRILSSSNTYVSIYTLLNTVTAVSKIDWIMLERGNKPSDFSPANEDISARFQILDNEISSKVSTTDYTGTTIASKINQSPTTVKIDAQHIQLEGLVTVNNRFKVLLDGSIEALNAKLGGELTTYDANGRGLRMFNRNLAFYGSVNNNLRGLLGSTATSGFEGVSVLLPANASKRSLFSISPLDTYNDVTGDWVSGLQMFVAERQPGGREIISVYSEFFALKAIQRGTVILNSSSAKTVTFSQTMQGSPMIVLTPSHNISGAVITAKVVSASSSGFSAIIQGTPTSSDVLFYWIAIS